MAHKNKQRRAQANRQVQAPRRKDYVVRRDAPTQPNIIEIEVTGKSGKKSRFKVYSASAENVDAAFHETFPTESRYYCVGNDVSLS